METPKLGVASILWLNFYLTKTRVLRAGRTIAWHRRSITYLQGIFQMFASLRQVQDIFSFIIVPRRLAVDNKHYWLVEKKYACLVMKFI